MTSKRRETTYALFFLAPFLLVLGIFFIYAFFNVVRYSFTDYNLFNRDDLSWVGVRNYVQVLADPLFGRAMFNTLAYALIVTGAQTFLALVLATVLNQRIRGINVFRTVYYLPSVLSSAAVTLIFLWLYQRNGFINFAVTWLNRHLFILLAFLILFAAIQAGQVLFEKARGLRSGFFNPALALLSLLVAALLTFGLYGFEVVELREVEAYRQVWLNTRERWLGIPIPLWAIMFQNIYTTVPTFMLLYLAGLQDVPKVLYEAAAIDGADWRQQFFRITVPLLRPVSFLVVTLGLIGTLQVFDQVALFGDAAPLESKISLAYYVYQAAFPSASMSRIGEASAAALLLGALILIVVVLQRALGIREEAY